MPDPTTVPQPGDTHAQRHAHGIDCCWDCFDGKRVHPRGADDPACEERASEDCRCTYAQTLP